MVYFHIKSPQGLPESDTFKADMNGFVQYDEDFASECSIQDSSGISPIQGGQNVPHILMIVKSFSLNILSVTVFPSRSLVVKEGILAGKPEEETLSAEERGVSLPVVFPHPDKRIAVVRRILTSRIIFLFAYIALSPFKIQLFGSAMTAYNFKFILTHFMCKNSFFMEIGK